MKDQNIINRLTRCAVQLELENKIKTRILGKKASANNDLRLFLPDIEQELELLAHKIEESQIAPWASEISKWIECPRESFKIENIIRKHWKYSHLNGKRQTDKTELVVVDVSELLEYEFQKRTPILGNWLTSGSTTMIHAYRGIGKTNFSLGMATHVASGNNFLNWTVTRPFKVLYVEGEMVGCDMQKRTIDSIDRLKNKDFNSEFLKFIPYELQKNGFPNLTFDENKLEIEKHLDGVEVIFLDSIVTLFRNDSPNKEESWFNVQNWLLKLRKKGLAVILVHHDGKNGTQRGTSAKEDILDNVIHLFRPDDYTPEQGCRFELHFKKAREAFGTTVEPKLVQLQNDSWKVSKISSESDTVTIMKSQGMTYREISKETGLSLGKISKLIQCSKSDAYTE